MRERERERERERKRDRHVLFPSASPATPLTKVVYFTPRSVTPFMTSIQKPVGQITLRDFKALFDRPGFYRYHFKTMDKEFGMVKEEVRQCRTCCPGQ